MCEFKGVFIQCSIIAFAFLVFDYYVQKISASVCETATERSLITIMCILILMVS